MHGGWCCYKVAARLQRLGHAVLAPDLPGHGKTRRPE
jgi:pimeloyl-ACP methyl ester carboxylesterase